MLFQVDGEFLSFSWAESKMYGFFSMESAILTLSLGRMAWANSMGRFENNLEALKCLRIEKTHKKKDDFRILYFRAAISNIFLFFTFLLTSIYLAIHRKASFGDPNPSSWYWIIDLITSILCGYSNFLFLPIHALRAHAITREFEIFNEELENADKEKKLENLPIIRGFGARQIKLFEIANSLTERIERYMTWAPALSILAFLMATYIITEFGVKQFPALYHVCLIAYVISGFIMSFALMYPVAFIQEAMLATSHVLLNSTILQETNDPLIFENYRMILERSLHNRLTNNVLHVFSITRKNVERLFFVHSVMIIIMVWTFELDDGIAKGFEGIGKMIMMMNMTGSHDNV
ncbi:hypothetical protein L5515_009680 [Caenorhabditis briggsae]|nr:hypothetical protein L5515_009680 [Caenorhabditis briggsae]